MNSMKSKLLSLQIVLMVSLFSVMACSSSDSSEMSEMITLENDLSDKVSQSSVSEFGDKVFTRIWSDPPTLDPHLTGDTTSSAIVVEIFGGLVSFDTSLNLIPDLAESWDISEDAETYTFKIRKDAVFHDGKKVTADDFKWSFNRAVAPDTASPIAETYLGDIVGVKDVLEGVSDEISGITVLDEHTLQIKIDSPKSYFLQKLTYPTAYVLDKNNIVSLGSSWTDSPNGTGPFKLIEYKIGEQIVLGKHDDYHLGAAKLDKIVMNLAGGSSMAMYENDEIDITGVSLFDLERTIFLVNNGALITKDSISPPSPAGLIL